MEITRETLQALVARASRADAADIAEVRALADTTQALAEDYTEQFPVTETAGTEYVQQTLFDPKPYEVR